MYKKALLEGNYRHALSQRYQVAENIKTIRLVYPIIIFEALAKVVLTFVVFYLFIYPANVEDTRMLEHLFDVTLASYIASMPWMFILRHQPYRAFVGKYMPRVQMFRNEVVEIRTIQAVNGGEILMEPTQKDHFDMLQKDWNHRQR
uniref:PH domain-containing protein n=1 Tax=Ascaris lumbricoides TaxID=6252 RepID=A0A0M3IA56_ASCLU